MMLPGYMQPVLWAKCPGKRPDLRAMARHNPEYAYHVGTVTANAGLGDLPGGSPTFLQSPYTPSASSDSVTDPNYWGGFLSSALKTYTDLQMEKYRQGMIDKNTMNRNVQSAHAANVEAVDRTPLYTPLYIAGGLVVATLVLLLIRRGRK